MKGFLVILMAGAALAQDEAVKRGAALFRTTCAVAYCHGAEGTAGRAAKLVGHRLPRSIVAATVALGNAEKGMPGFSSSMKSEQIEAVVDYVMSLAGSGPELDYFGVPDRLKRTPEIEAGRRLFFDAARMNGCGACHEIDGWGVPVGPDLAKSNTGAVNRLPEIGSSRVMTVKPAKEAAFPGWVVDKGPSVKVYDLSSPLPVMRSFAGGAVTLEPGSAWSHRMAVAGYTGQELDSIGRFLRAMGAK